MKHYPKIGGKFCEVVIMIIIIILVALGRTK